MKNIKLSTKLMLAFLFVGICPLLIGSFICLYNSSKSLEKQAFLQLKGMREVKKEQIIKFFNERQGDMQVLVETVDTLRKEAFDKLIALREIKKMQIENFLEGRKNDLENLTESIETMRFELLNKLNSVRNNKKIQIETFFENQINNVKLLTDNPFIRLAFKEFNKVYYEGGGYDGGNFKGHGKGKFRAPGNYNMVHGKFFDLLKKTMDNLKYTDLILITSNNGDVNFSVAKKSDFGNRIKSIDSPLRDAWEMAIKGKIAISDIKPYAHSANSPSQFIAGPIKENGQIIGVVAVRISNEIINEIMKERSGLGEKGESYLVGKDLLMRSDTFLDIENRSLVASFQKPESGKVDTEASQNALAGKSGSDVIKNYNNNYVLSVYSPVKVGDLTWALITEMDINEAFCPRNEAGENLFQKYTRIYGFYDLFMINSDGYCFYTVAKEADYQTNLLTDKYKDSNLGKLVRKVIDTKKFSIVDMAPYEPSNFAPAIFIAQPLIHKGNVELIVALQLSNKNINKIMNQREGLGKTGETYLVGSDQLMRSDSFLDPKNHSVLASFADKQKGIVDTKASKASINGHVGADIIIDYNGNYVLSAYSPVKFEDLTWALIAEVDVAEAFCPKDNYGKYFFKKYNDIYGYYDLFLINPDGYCFYSVGQEADFQTNLVTGKFRNSNLGELIKKAIKTKKFQLADFKPYEPSNNEPAAFIAQPVLHDTEVDLIVALQISLDAINNIMQQRVGMGKTGETYLVGSDKLMRSDSLLDPENHSVKASFKNHDLGKVDTRASNEALLGKSNEQIINDYNGNTVLSSYTSISVGDTIWALIAEIDKLEAFESIASLKKVISFITLIVIFGIVLIALLITRSITNPVKAIVDFIAKVKEGDQKITYEPDSHDEIGQMGKELNEMVLNIRKLIYNLDYMPAPVMEIDKDFNIVYLNKIGLEIIGSTLNDVKGKKCYKYFKTEQCNTDNCACQQAMRKNSIITEDTVADPEGLNIPIRYTGIPITNNNGKIVGAQEFIIDISGEREINAAIVEIIKSVEAGKLDLRGDASKFKGSYAELVNNVNNIVEAFVKPLTVTADYVDRISKGDIPEKITDDYQGDFDKLKNNLNQCIEAVNALVNDARMLVEASIQGKLDTRADSNKHLGDFSKIIKGINDTLDAVLLPIKEAGDVLQKISCGDLRTNVVGNYQGDHAMIKNAINSTIDSLNKILTQVKIVSDNVNASSGQLTEASHSLAEGSQQQAASVEQISASVHETDSQIKLNADNASNANELVIETSNAASTGQKEMNNMTNAMEEINTASQNISKIIKAIDEIAFQTNILALNAAVEAARAGQHGKGFAVVAQEVRNLAGRSAQAAGETAEMIENSNKRTQEGVDIAQKTSASLEEIVENIAKVKDLVSQIATASKEQTQAMGQVNEGMNQISNATQSISAQSEETAASAKELSKQSQNLDEQLKKFKLAGALNADEQSITKAVDPKAVLSLDEDERGFENF